MLLLFTAINNNLCYFWSSLAQPTAKLLVPTLIINYNTTKNPILLFSKNVVSETEKTSVLKVKSSTCLNQGSWEAHTSTWAKKRVLQFWGLGLTNHLSAVTALPGGWLDKLSLRSQEVKKKKSLSTWKKFEPLQLSGTGHLGRQMNLNQAALPQPLDCRCRNIGRDSHI